MGYQPHVSCNAYSAPVTLGRATKKRASKEERKLKENTHASDVNSIPFTKTEPRFYEWVKLLLYAQRLRRVLASGPCLSSPQLDDDECMDDVDDDVWQTQSEQTVGFN